jgi:hypothetical protein
MAKASTPTGPTVGNPPNEPNNRSSDILLTEVAKLQSDGEYTRRDLNELRTDMRDLRDRIAKLEVRVDHLPSKEFIVTVTVIALGIIGALVTLAPKLQGLAGTAPATFSVSPPTQAK